MENQNTYPVMPRMLTLKEMAKETGLAYEYLRKLCLTNQIVYVKSGSKYLINYNKFVDFVNGEMTRKAAGENGTKRTIRAI